MQSKNNSLVSSYKLTQMFGYKGPGQKIQQEDIIAKLKFDKSGKFLALGDHAGRIIIFQTKEANKKNQSMEYYAQFQSHSREFDPLRSEQVSESITDICWLNNQGKYQKLLTSNQRSIKVWKLFEKSYKKVGKSCGKDFQIPKLQTIQNNLEAFTQLTFPTKHITAINCVNNSYNEQFVISTDDVQAFYWDLEDPSKPFVISDFMKGKALEQVKQNITCNQFHPSSDSMFLIGSDKGSLKLNDLRISSNINNGTAFLSQKGAKNFFTQMVNSYSSLAFMKGGKYIAARDYLNVKIWDVANATKPVSTICLQQNLKGKLCDLFQNDGIYDKFSLDVSEDGNQIITGNYNNSFHMLSSLNQQNIQYQLNYKKSTISRAMTSKMPALSKLDNLRKTTACGFNPKRKMAAVASLNCFFIYSL